eukprot:TRINITY_DN16813_c0_g1_i1.p1 TRINITY_DN16813_c0_g1~~TRINITY_DN16813_c0_g1_i1.p1  ORF type:complete len:840 (+),score=161.92 TRINITY_DN16813_c0_g1_i1:20-2539(+)
MFAGDEDEWEHLLDQEEADANEETMFAQRDTHELSKRRLSVSKVSGVTEVSDTKKRSRIEAPQPSLPERKRLRVDNTDKSAWVTSGGFSKKPLEGDCIYITTEAGERVYVSVSPKTTAAKESRVKPKYYGQSLLSTPISELNKLVNELELSSFSQNSEAELLLNSDSKFLDTAIPVEHQLWVDKYAPKSFLDLLSDDKTNRSILSWLKEWDPYVFKKAFTAVSPSKYNPVSKKVEKVARKPSSGRPEQKVILLWGPPGVGKTTLAHIIARHAGYEPIEMNASDTRTKKDFIPQVLDVLEIQSISFGKDTKPKCLIIDEIDGILGREGTGAIDALVALIDEKPSKKQQQALQQKGKASNESSFRLHRPIICICNDAWVPALRTLKEKALVFKLAPPNPNTLLKRVSYIANKEAVKIDNKTLQGLCELTGNDIRSCINTLQFLSKMGRVSSDLITKAAFGVKDMTDNIFDVWQSIFVKKNNSGILQSLVRDRLREERLKVGSSADQAQRTIPSEPSQSEQVYNLVSRHGEFDKVVDGAYVYYPTMGYNDPMLSKTQSILEWLEFYSLLSGNFTEHGLNKYLAYVPVAMHSMCSVAYLSSSHIQYPKQQLQLDFNIRQSRALVKNFVDGVSPHYRRFLGGLSSVNDILPYFMNIIDPVAAGRRVTSLNNDAKTTEYLRAMASHYLDYGLHFKQVKGPENETLFEITPPVGTIVKFQSLVEGEEKVVLPMRICRILSYEIDKERAIRRKRQFMEHQEGDGDVEVENLIVEEEEFIEPEPEKEVPVVQKMGLGSWIKKPVATTSNNPKKPQTPAAPKSVPRVYFKYHEGFTNAVKRKVYIKDFL